MPTVTQRSMELRYPRTWSELKRSVVSVAWKEGQIPQWRQSKFSKEFNSDDYTPRDRPWYVLDQSDAQVNFIKNHNLPTDIDATTLERLMLDARDYGNTYPSQLGSIPSGSNYGPKFFKWLESGSRIGPGSIQGPMKLGERISTAIEDLKNKLGSQTRLMQGADPGDPHPQAMASPDLGQPSRRTGWQGWPTDRTYLLPDDIQYQVAKRKSKAALTDRQGWFSSKLRGRKW